MDSPNSEPPQRFIIKVLLQEATFLKNWQQVCDALDVPTREMFQMASRFSAGSASMYDVIQWMLETWRGRNGKDANIHQLIRILIEEGLNHAAEMVRDLVQRHNDNVTSQLPVPRLTGQESEAMAERNLEVLERIDGGSFSEVFKVRCHFDNKKFALKRICIGKFVVLTKTSRSINGWDYFRKLLREVNNMAQLAEHPNIVAYNEAWFEGPLRKKFSEWLKFRDMPPPQMPALNNPTPSEEEKSTFMCIKMELMETNLGHWLDNNPETIGNFDKTKFITTEILTGLAFMHSKNIVHRDLKPNNILINFGTGFGWVIKIGDFGLSRDMRETDTSLTVQVGGKSFSSPEMERGDAYDLKTDIFSVGLICLVMLHKFENLQKLERALDDARRGDLGTVTLIESLHQKDYSLLKGMLDRHSEKRPSAAEALKVLQAPVMP